MGSMSRMERSQKFVDEFNADIVPQASVQIGMHLTVKCVRLGFNDRDDVVLVADLEAFGGLPKITVELGDGVIYDPDYCDNGDTADHLSERFGVENALLRLDEHVGV